MWALGLIISGAAFLRPIRDKSKGPKANLMLYFISFEQFDLDPNLTWSVVASTSLLWWWDRERGPVELLIIYKVSRNSFNCWSYWRTWCNSPGSMMIKSAQANQVWGKPGPTCFRNIGPFISGPSSALAVSSWPDPGLPQAFQAQARPFSQCALSYKH